MVIFWPFLTVFGCFRPFLTVSEPFGAPILVYFVTGTIHVSASGSCFPAVKWPILGFLAVFGRFGPFGTVLGPFLDHFWTFFGPFFDHFWTRF